MSAVFAVMRREWWSFVGSDKGTLVAYVFILCVYSAVFTVNPYESNAARLWWIFYSVVAVSTVSGNAMVRERSTGALEVLFTSGISRAAVLYGKIGFGFIMSLFMGGVPFGVSRVVGVAAGLQPDTADWSGFLLYMGAACVNLGSVAWFSVVLPNPRLVHFVNLVLLSLLIGLRAATGMKDNAFIPLLFGAGLLLSGMALRAFNGERVVEKVNL